MSGWIGQFIEWNNRRLLFNKALIFNKANTFKTRFNNIEARWMCPECGKIHKSNGWTCFTGSQYEKCCEFPSGNRCYKESATGF